MPTQRRVTPLAGWSVVAAFLLIGFALLATVWTTRASVIDASDAVRRGEAVALQQAVRADLADLEGPPTHDDLEAVLRAHAAAGLRFVARIDREGAILDKAGDAVGIEDPDVLDADLRPREISGGRLRLSVRRYPRMRDGDGRWRVIIEVEPVQSAALRGAATLTLGVGALAAAGLIGVAIVLVRREARRNAEAREHEHERRLASLGEMSAVLAHEIKNPLASLKGNAQLLAATLPEGEKSHSKAGRVVDEAIRLEKLTNDLLQFVRTGILSREPVDPGAVVREAITSVNGEVTIDTKSAPRKWSLDAGRIQQVVRNLVDNAVAAGPPVEVSVSEREKRLVIEVRDRGPGVPVDEREKIFEPFFTAKTQGTGLGLAVVRRVIEQHGGTIAVTSNPEGGALFRAEIPET